MLLNKLFQGERMLALLQSFKGALLASFVLGVIATLGYAPFNLWPFTTLSLAFMLWTLTIQEKPKMVFFIVFIYFISLNTTNLWWLNFVMQDFGQLPFIVSWLGVLLLSIYLALPYSLLSFLVLKYFSKNIVAYILCFIPVIFLVSDIIVGYLFTGFPWVYLGYSTLGSPFETYAPLLGVRGINLMLVITAASIALAITRRFIFLPIAGVIFAFAIIFMGTSFTKDSEQSQSFTLVQGNIEQSLKWNAEQVVPTITKYMNLSDEYMDKRRNVVVWPESAIPLFIEQADPFIYTIVENAMFTNTHLITGIQHMDKNGHIYNTIANIHGKTTNENYELYKKRHLVPFGEFVPFENLLRPLAKIFNFPMSGFTKGEYIQDNIKIGSINMIPAICYEAIFPELIASLDSKESQGILMVSNDSWFGLTRGPQEHLDIARMRALELQKPMIRATNSGITAYIGKDGKVIDSLPQNIDAILNIDFIGAKGETPFSALGEKITYFLSIIMLLLGILIYKRDFDPKKDALVSMVRP